MTIPQQIEDYNTQLAMGRLLSHDSRPHIGVDKFAINLAVPSGSFAGVWYNGGPFTFQQSAQVINVRAGGNAADTADGVGARSITVFGLNETFQFDSEKIATNGVSASVPTTKKFWRVFRAWNLDVGAYGGSNTADMILENEDNDIVANIQAGTSSTQIAMMSIPAGYTGLLKGMQIGVNATQQATVNLFQRENLDVIEAPFGSMSIRKSFEGLENFSDVTFKSFLTIPTMADFWVEARGDVGVSKVSVNFDMELIPA